MNIACFVMSFLYNTRHSFPTILNYSGKVPQETYISITIQSLITDTY